MKMMRSHAKFPILGILLYMAFVLVGCSRGNISDDQAIAKYRKKIRELITKAGSCQQPLIDELKVREQFGDSLRLQFDDFDTDALYDALATLRESLRSGISPEEILGNNSSYYFLREKNLFTREEIIHMKMVGIGVDYRTSLQRTNHPSDFHSAALNYTVVVVPYDMEFGNVQNQKYCPKRDSLICRFGKENYDSNIKFGDQYTFAPGTRSGVLLNDSIVLTAGHSLVEGDSLYILKNFHGLKENGPMSIDDMNFRLGRVIYAYSGGAAERDYALIKLNTAFPKITPILDTIAALDTANKSLLVAGHPLGMQLIADSQGTLLPMPMQHLHSGTYCFANLDVNSGSSGSPVYQRQQKEGQTPQLKLIGIVIGSGGAEDFGKKSNSWVWNQLDEEDAVGTRILLLESLKKSIKSIISPPSKSPSNQNSRRPEQISQIQNMPLPLGKYKTYNLTEYSISIVGTSLIVRKNSNGSFVPYDLTKGALFYMDAPYLHFQIATSFEEYVRCIPHLPRCLQYHTDTWPMDLFSSPRHYLKFQTDVTLPAEIPFRHNANAKFNLLDGIGSADIIDNLPHRQKMQRRMMWLCNRDLLEITAIPKVTGNPYQQAIIKIRTVRPFVHTYLRVIPDPNP